MKTLIALLLLAVHGAGFAAAPRIAVIYDGGESNGPAEFRRAAERHKALVSVDFYAPGEGGLALKADTDLGRYALVFLDAATEGLPLQAKTFEVLRAKTRLVVLNPQGVARGNVSLAAHPDLARYWENRSLDNDAALVAYLATRVLDEKTTAKVPAPITYPEHGFYHPAAPRLFNTLDAYLAWYGARKNAHAYDAAKFNVGMSTHLSNVLKKNLKVQDALIAEIERRGHNAITLARKGGVDFAYFKRGEKALIDVLLYEGEMLDHKDRDAGQAQARLLGVPMLNTLTHHKLTAAEYRASPLGLAPDLTPRVVNSEQDGMIEPIVVGARDPSQSLRRSIPIPGQVRWRITRALAWAKLRRADNADKRLVFTYWSEAGGKADVGGDPDDFLDVQGTLASMLPALRKQGYDVGKGPLPDAEALASKMAREASNIGNWSPGEMARRVANSEVALIPEATYLQWFKALPAARAKEIVATWGPPPGRTMIHTDAQGKRFLVIPKVSFGKVVIAPHPMWGYLEDEKVLLSKDALPPHHQYLAFFLWMQKEWKADAWIPLFSNLVLQPGKSQGPLAGDHVGLMLGGIPHIHPSRLGASGGMGNKRKAMAAALGWYNIVVPSDALENVAELRALTARYQGAADDGTREAIAPTLRAAVVESGLSRALGMNPANAKLPELVAGLEAYFAELETANMPWGGKVLGTAPQGPAMTAMVTGMLGQDLLAALTPLSNDPRGNARPLVAAVLDGGKSPAAALKARFGKSSPAAEAQLALARSHAKALRTAPREVAAIFEALEGKWIEPGPMGEPFRKPEVLPPGRALYNFDQRAIPTVEAEATGIKQAEALIAAHRKENDGAYPDKFAFVLWSGEVAKNNGVTEAQVLHLLGTRAVRNWRGEVTGVELIPRKELGRPRVDVLVTTSGTYRDHFQDKVELITEATRLASASREADNAVAEGTRATRAQLKSAGTSPQRAVQLALARVFSPAPGAYSPSIQFLAKSGDQRGDEARMADLYTRRLSHAYGGGLYGEYSRPTFEQNLARMDAAVLPRSGDVNGLLDNPMPAGFLGGLNLAAKAVTGNDIALYVSNLRDPKNASIESAARMLQTELRTRYFNPKWIRENQAHGYDGARNFMFLTDHLDLWDSTATKMVTSADWAEVKRVFVDDKFELDMDAFFDRANPFAHQMLMTNLLGAAQRGDWQATPEELAQIAKRLSESVIEHGPACEANQCRNQAMTEFVGKALSTLPDAAPLLEGYTAAIDSAAPAAGAAPGAAPQVTGQVMEEVRTPESEPVITSNRLWILLSAIVILLFLSGWTGWPLDVRRARPALRAA